MFDRDGLSQGNHSSNALADIIVRIAVISITLLFVLPRCGMAQHAPDWLDSNAEDRSPVPNIIDSTCIVEEGKDSHDMDPNRHDHHGHDPGQIFNQPVELPVVRFKKQAIQKITVAGGWLVATEGNDLGSSYLETSISVGIPVGLIRKKLSSPDERSFGKEPAETDAGTPEILSISPAFRVDFIDAAQGIDVPTDLYETGVSFFYLKPINDRLSAMAIVRPSVRSDFTTSDNAFRLFGLGLLTWDCVPDKLSLSFGAVYLDRADLPLLPAVGVTWTPQTTMRMELQFPQSRLAWRLAKDGAASETWSYISAGIGGYTWAVTRADGRTDELSLGDIRLLLGLDHIVDGGGGLFAELGYALNRHIEYQSTLTKTNLSDGIVLQAGWRY